MNCAYDDELFDMYSEAFDRPNKRVRIVSTSRKKWMIRLHFYTSEAKHNNNKKKEHEWMMATETLEAKAAKQKAIKSHIVHRRWLFIPKKNKIGTAMVNVTGFITSIKLNTSR